MRERESERERERERVREREKDFLRRRAIPVRGLKSIEKQ